MTKGLVTDADDATDAVDGAPGAAALAPKAVDGAPEAVGGAPAAAPDAPEAAVMGPGEVRAAEDGTSAEACMLSAKAIRRFSSSASDEMSTLVENERWEGGRRRSMVRIHVT